MTDGHGPSIDGGGSGELNIGFSIFGFARGLYHLATKSYKLAYRMTISK